MWIILTHVKITFSVLGGCQNGHNLKINKKIITLQYLLFLVEQEEVIKIKLKLLKDC